MENRDWYIDESERREPIREEKPILIEQTTKRWKVWQLAGVGIILLDIIALLLLTYIFPRPSDVKNPGFAFAAFAVVLSIGVLVWIYGRVMAWWHHG